jgi:hypothetical protein
MEFFLGEALRLSGVQPLHDQADRASLLWSWLAQRNGQYISLPELTQFAPNKLRKAETLRNLMAVLTDHYLVRKMPEGMVEFNGKSRREAWEVRL